MPSPFPGMDPYLEGSLWLSVHTPLAVEFVRQLTPRLRPRYMALTTRRYVMDVLEESATSIEGIYPDVSVLRAGDGEAGALGGHAYPSVVQMTTLMPEAIPQTSVEIRQTGTRQLVTVIEILSPTNKQGDGRDEYLAKRNRLLLSKAHLMEVELLRRGRRVPMREPMPPVPYFIFLSRADRRPRTDVWPIPLDQPLPKVPVPLMAGDTDVYLDLQQALTSVYENCGLDLAIDYLHSPEVPLSPEADKWARNLLDSQGHHP